jgi:hypothetical protein
MISTGHILAGLEKTPIGSPGVAIFRTTIELIYDRVSDSRKSNRNIFSHSITLDVASDCIT